MRKSALIVHSPPKGSALIEPIHALTTIVDLVLVTRAHRTIRSRGGREVAITIPDDATSAFQGGTLRPLVALEDILREADAIEVYVVGEPLDLVVQTALDANALGYATTVFQGAMPSEREAEGRLERAGVGIVPPLTLLGSSS